MHKLLTKRVFTTFFIFVCFLSLVACGNKTENSLDEMQSGSQNNGNLTVIGFSQLGAESDWRSENTLSMKETFTEEKGYKLIFEDGQQKQSNQMMAIRKFIQQEVDYIVLAPVTETGWDNVLIDVVFITCFCRFSESRFTVILIPIVYPISKGHIRSQPFRYFADRLFESI